MSPRPSSRGEALLSSLLLTAAIALAGCGASATPTPSQTPSSTPSPSPTPSSTPSPSPTPRPSPASSSSASIDAAADVKIAAPYELATLDPAMEEQMLAAMKSAMGAFGIISVGARQVTKNGQLESFLIVEQLPPLVADVPGLLDQVMTGLVGTTGEKVTKKTINGVTVASTKTGSLTAAVFQLGHKVLFVLGPTPESATAVATSLIGANK